MLDRTDPAHRIFAAPGHAGSHEVDDGDVTASLRPPGGTTFSAAILLWLFVGGVALPLLSIWLYPEARSTGCQAAPLPLRLGTETAVQMAVSPGMACTLAVPVTTASLDDVVVTMPPAHGAVTPRGRSGIVYRAKPAFSGDDAFAFALSGHSESGAGTMTVLVNVTVR